MDVPILGILIAIVGFFVFGWVAFGVVATLCNLLNDLFDKLIK